MSHDFHKLYIWAQLPLIQVDICSLLNDHTEQQQQLQK